MPQKIDALAEAINKKDYSLIKKILTASSKFEETLQKEAIITNYKLNLEKLSSKKERLLCKAVINQDYEACLLLLQYGVAITGSQTFSYYDNISRRHCETNPSALAYAMRDADLTLVKLLLMNDDSVSNIHLDKALALTDWDNITQKKIKERPDYDKLIHMIECYKYLKQGLYTPNSLGDRGKQSAEKLTMIIQALKEDNEFTLDCFEAIIKELNCLSQGLSIDTRLTQLDRSEDLASLRIFIHAITCYFNIVHLYNTLSPQFSLRMDQALIDLLALQNNLKQSDELKEWSPFASAEAAREFVLFNIKNPQYKATIQIMSNSTKKKTDEPTASQAEPVDLAKSLFFSPAPSLNNTNPSILPLDESKQILEEKPSQPYSL